MAPRPLDDRPETRRNHRQRVWGAVGCLLGAALSGTFFVVTITKLTACEGDDCTRSGYPALTLVVPVMLLWEGLVVLPREARLLRRPGVRQLVEPNYGVVRVRTWFGPFPHRELEERWWLRLVDVGDGRLGIPVSELDAERCAPDIHALVRGPLRRRGRVVLDFPDLILWPSGRIERLPEET